MTQVLEAQAALDGPAGAAYRPGLAGWLTSTDHKRIGLMTAGTALFLFFAMGAIALTMRTQLAQPGQHVVGLQLYNELFTVHGSGMIYAVITPLAMALGVYLVPIQVGAPGIAGPRLTLTGFWLYVFGAFCIVLSLAFPQGASSGWFSYTPLSDSQFSPGHGMDIWILGVVLTICGMILMAGTILWTALRMRAPTMSLLRMPVFTWAMVVSCLMTVAAFPSAIAAMCLIAVGRIHPAVFSSNVWNIGYQYLFWFYGHPVVYVMFFPFVGCVAEVIATFSGRKFFGYKGTVFALMTFSTLSMAVFGHHMFTTGEAVNQYYSLTSILLSVPAGLEYFGLLGTLVGGRLRFTTPMLFALAWLPQFLIGGLSGIMMATPVIDYHVEDSYFVVAHFHYTLFAGSVFGFFAGVYYWFPKATGVMLRNNLGKAHFWVMVVGTNLAFGPMFGLGLLGMPRRVATYSANAGFTTLSLISSIGAGIIGLSMMIFAYNVIRSLRNRIPAPPDPWGGTTLEWATSSPPPPFNFDAEYPVPPIHSYAPLLDLREAMATVGPDPDTAQTRAGPTGGDG